MSDFERFVDAIKRNTVSMTDKNLPDDFLLGSDGDLSVYYAPFDYINRQARITICGITPGFQQAVLALNQAKKQLLSGSSIDESRRSAKETASFGGSMRSNLIDMLDHIGTHMKLGLESCEQLFSSHTHLVHYTSALRYPVFVGGKNYNGDPDMIATRFLKQQMETYLSEEIESLPDDCIYIPLGPKVTKAFSFLINKGIVNTMRVLDGMPHPSGGNRERIYYFLEKKKKEDLSNRTNPDQIDEAKRRLREKLAEM
jgi:hypothetical protein